MRKPIILQHLRIYSLALYCLALTGTLLIANSLLFAETSAAGSTTATEKSSIAGKRVAQAKFSELSYNFGSVSEGATVSHSFKVKNVGNAELLIQRVVPACGCTAVSASKDPLAPGESTSIDVDFDTKGFTGAKTKTVRVYSNDFQTPAVTLSVSGKIESEATLNPARILFDDMVKGSEPASKEFEIDIRPESGKKIVSVVTYSKIITVEPVSAAPNNFAAARPAAAANSQSAGRYRVSIDPQAQVGEIRDRIIVNLAKGKEVSSLTLPVIGRVTGTVLIDPPQISFGIVEGKEVLERTVILKNFGKTPVEISEITSDTPSVVPSMEVVEPGKSYKIKVKLDAAQVTRDLRALIEVRTSSVEVPSLFLSVFGVVPPTL